MRFLMLLLSVALAAPAYSQTELFSENFAENVSDWTLNTGVLGGTMMANQWVINLSYTGGTGSITCFDIPFAFTANPTPNQPGAIPGSPNGHYMHISSNAAAGGGIYNCVFSAADGFCVPEESNFAQMNTDFSTVGYSNVALSFWWLCSGSNANFGEVYYSLDGGSSWQQVTGGEGSYFGQGNWTQETVSMPEWDNQPSVRLGFRFVNGTSISAMDPAFGLDEIVVTGSEEVVVVGCTDPAAINYDPAANQDSGCCTYFDLSTICGDGTLWDESTGTCVAEVPDLSIACGEGTVWDEATGTCISDVTVNPCPPDLDNNGLVTTNDLLILLGAFGTPCTE